MGLATNDPHSQKEHTEIHKIPKFGANQASEVFFFQQLLVKNIRKTTMDKPFCSYTVLAFFNKILICGIRMFWS